MELTQENRIIHGVWIGKKLSKMECLTIELLQRQGHEFHLWSYDSIANVPHGVIARDASLIMPRSSIFEYRGKPLNVIPNGGIGSFAHWSDIFQVNLLYKEGGIYSQMDVAYLKQLNFKQPYVFASLWPYLWPNSIQTFLMKAPKGSLFCKECAEELEKLVVPNNMPSLDWFSTLRVITQIAQKHKLIKYSLSRIYINDLGGQRKGTHFYEDRALRPMVYIIHWSNATHFDEKDNPIPGSLYEYLIEHKSVDMKYKILSCLRYAVKLLKQLLRIQ